MRRDLLKWNKVLWNKSLWQKVNIMASSALCKHETNGFFCFSSGQRAWVCPITSTNNVIPLLQRHTCFLCLYFKYWICFAKHLLLVYQIFCKWRYLTNGSLTLCNALGTSATNINVWEARMAKCDTFWTFTKVWLSYHESPMAKVWALTFKWLCVI